jgi:hypothetical protein
MLFLKQKARRVLRAGFPDSKVEKSGNTPPLLVHQEMVWMTVDVRGHKIRV